MQSNPNALLTLTKNCIFTNVALTSGGDIWWEGLSQPPTGLTSWLGTAWQPSDNQLAAHPNARFTAPLRQCPVADPAWDDPRGVPISAILFGGRRPTTIPLVFQALSWQHGVFLGSCQSSETTAAQTGAVGVVRHDPMAMLPFCGYNMGDYLRHWLAIGQHSTAEKLPKIFYVNWFRKSSSGQWLWPGYGENIRVLKWIYERVTGEAPASISPIGQLPLPTALDTSQLKITPAQLTELLRFDKSGWQQELIGLRQHYARLGDRLPTELREELAALARHLDSA